MVSEFLSSSGMLHSQYGPEVAIIAIGAFTLAHTIVYAFLVVIGDIIALALIISLEEMWVEYHIIFSLRVYHSAV